MPYNHLLQSLLRRKKVKERDVTIRYQTLSYIIRIRLRLKPEMMILAINIKQLFATAPMQPIIDSKTMTPPMQVRSMALLSTACVTSI
jgi:hypothetical protein